MAEFAEDNEAHNPGSEADGENNELFLRLKKWFIAARDHSNKWRKQAEEDYNFVAGEQWNEEDKDTLRSQLRPVITFNRCSVITDSVAGQEIQNRQEVRYLPRQMGDVGVNEVYTAAGKWFRDQSSAEEEESDSFLDMVICGLGWVDNRLDYEIEPEGSAVTDRIDPLEMYWDPGAHKRNLEDRRYQFRAREIPLEDAEEMFPQFRDDQAALHAGWAGVHPHQDEPHNALEAKFYRNDQSGREAGDPISKVTLVHAQWWDREPYYRVHDQQNRRIVQVSEPRWQKMTAQFQRLGVPMPKAVRGTGRTYKQAFLGARILSLSESPCPGRFTINPMTGKRDRNKNDWYGLVRPMKDPQRWANKFFSSMIHQISTSGKGVVLPTDAVVSQRQFEEDWARPDGIKWTKPGFDASKIQQLQGAQINPGTINLMQYAVQGTRDVTGVNIEMLGQQQNDQAGVLEYQRKMAGITILAPFFDSLRRFRKYEGHILLHYIRTYFTDGRLIRIDGQEGAKYIPLVRDPSQEVYDVIVDDAPTSPNQKEHTWLLITQLMPVLRGLSDPTVWAELLKYSPLPSSLTEKLAQYAMQKSQQPPQMAPKDQARAQYDQGKLQIEAQRAQADAENKRANAIAALAKAGIRGPGPQEQAFQAAIDALINAGQSAQDHQEALQQSAQEHQQDMVQAEQANQHALQQGAQQHAAALQQGQQQAALQPPPQGQ